MHFRLGELFSGAGGLALGAVHANSGGIVDQSGDPMTISHAWANDLEFSACQTYAANIMLHGERNLNAINQAIISAEEWQKRNRANDTADMPTVICGSVEKVTSQVQNLPAIDGFAFGFPCNDFSAVGERKGLEGDFGPLYMHGITVLNHHKPRWFIAENVAGLLHSDKKRVIAKIRAELEAAGPGYVLTEHLYAFEEYGVPQRRTRLVIVGISKPDTASGIVFRVPAPTTKFSPRTAKWALEHDPFAPDDFKPVSADAYNHIIKVASEKVRNRLKHTRPGQNAWSADIPKEYALHVKKVHLSMIYRRLEADEPAYTITGNGGGGTHGYHWEEPRALTNRERARLQSFPDDYCFYGNEGSVRKQIGMAVPPLAAKHIFEAILKTYAGEEYVSTEASIHSTPQNRRRTASKGLFSEEEVH